MRSNPMSEPLPPILAAYIAASNAKDAEALCGCFTADAVVIDEGQMHRGTEAIRQWAVQTQAAYDFTLAAIGVARQRDETVVTCRLTGRFPGSPIDMNFRFTLQGDRIVALTIRP